MNRLTPLVLLAYCLVALGAAAPAASGAQGGTQGEARPGGEALPAYGAELEGFDYPYPVHHYAFTSQRQALQMAYMDVVPEHPNGRTIVLLHGKNFCAGTWESSLVTLSAAGYRVIAPDQIGFCKSSKPVAYQFTFAQLARNTRDLLASLGVTRALIMGHSTGGMLAIRYALQYPESTEALVLVSPLGLEDWRAKGVPPLSVDDWMAREKLVSAARIRAYEKSTYYGNEWRPEYERWVEMLAGMYNGPGRDAVAWNSALIYDMILTEPVYYELDRLRVPVLLVIGDLDTTAIGREAASDEARKNLGHYAEIGPAASRIIPNATLVEFAHYGHAPQIQDPAAFHAALLPWLSSH